MDRKVLIHDIDQHYPSVRQRLTRVSQFALQKLNELDMKLCCMCHTHQNSLIFYPRKTSLIKTTPKIPSMTSYHLQALPTSTTSFVFNKSILTILMSILINNVVIGKVTVFEICCLEGPIILSPI